jgi:hypothetical protein
MRGECQPGEVGEGGACGECPAPLRRQPDQIPQPAQHDRFRRVGEPRRRTYERVLVEQRDRPVGSQRGRGGTADDEVEEPRPSRRSSGYDADAQQFLHGWERANALLRQRATEFA